MKLPKECIEELRSAIAPLDTPEIREGYRNGNFPRADLVKDLDKRYRWDLLYASGFVVCNLYGLYGVNDNHIDSALRTIVPTLDETAGVA